jgi:hypothetical protein
MTNKIAIVFAGIMQVGRDSNAPLELRYTMWEMPKRDPHAVSKMRAVLPYDGMLTPHEIFQHATFSYSLRSTRADIDYMHDKSGGFIATMSAKIEEKATMRTILLGHFDGHDCYLVEKPQDQIKGHFSVASMPLYGRSSVVYQANTVRETFGHTSIVNVTHSGNPSDEEALFNFIDEKVQAHFAPLLGGGREPNHSTT